MFIYSAKMNKRKLAAILAGVAVVILVLVFVFARGGSGPDSQTGDAARAEQLKLLKSSRLETNEDRLALLTALGWEVQVSPVEYSEVRIPREFSQVYENYNDVQKEQGLNLAKYKGEKVMRYTYAIVNHPSGENDVHATLLVYKNRLIGGDICTARLDGFLHGLLMPEKEGANDELPSTTDEAAASTPAEGTKDADAVDGDDFPTD